MLVLIRLVYDVWLERLVSLEAWEEGISSLVVQGSFFGRLRVLFPLLLCGHNLQKWMQIDYSTFLGEFD